MIHAFINRINANLKEFGKQPLSGKQNALIAVGALVGSVVLAQVGIIDLIAKGYTFMVTA